MFRKNIFQLVKAEFNKAILAAEAEFKKVEAKMVADLNAAKDALDVKHEATKSDEAMRIAREALRNLLDVKNNN